VSEVTDPREDELQLPVGWHDWPDENKIEYLRLSVSREAQLDQIRRATRRAQHDDVSELR